MQEYEFVYTGGGSDRIDKYLTAQLPDDFSRSYIQKLVKSGSVTVNHESIKVNYKPTCGDRIRISVPEPKEPDILPEDIPLDILYEDADILIVNKPKGMVVHPAAGHYTGTLVNALMFRCKDNLSGINGVLRPGIVHRIDRNTTGSLVVCKNDQAHRFLEEQLKMHAITRKYRAIVHGRLKEDGSVNAPIGRNTTDRKKMAVNYSNGKEAITHYHILRTFREYTYIECQLETGRTHQIRVHMAAIGHPILGDDVYGPAKCPYKHLEGQTLHAMTLGFIHPATRKYVEFTAELPPYFEDLLKRLP